MNIKKTILAIIFFLSFIGIPLEKAAAITIIPPRAELTSNPGEAVSGIIKIYNETSDVLTLYATTANFTAKQGKEGVPEFFSPEESNYDLASWIQIEKGPIDVLPSEYRLIDYSINVPLDADPGGHYAGIFFGSGNPDEKNSKTAVGISSKTGALILLAVSGKVSEIGSLEEFILKDGKSFYERLPVDFVIGFENAGNVHLRPEGEITIKNIFGKTVSVIDVNKRKIGTGINILPKTLRHLEVSWKMTDAELSDAGQDFWDKIKAEQENFALGKYTASLNLVYGSKKNTVQRNVSFWVFPWHLILVYFLGGLFLLLILRFLIKRYNRWIISQAMKK